MPSPQQNTPDAEQQTAIAGAWLIAGIGASVALLLAGMAQNQITFDLFASVTRPFWLVCVTALVLRVVLAMPDSRWQRLTRDGCEHFGLFALVALIGVLASYPAAADSRGFVDGSIERVDHLLRLNWVSWYKVVAAHPALQLAGRLAYQSIFVSPVLLLGFFTVAERKAEARRFIAAFWVAAVLTLLLFLYLPAKGPLATLWHGPIPYMPSNTLDQVALILELRHHLLHRIEPADLHGLVCTPSFHAASAILYMMAGWRIRTLRWPVIALNVAMLISTPVEGTHYFADMIAGAAVAGTAWFVVAALEQRLNARSGWKRAPPEPTAAVAFASRGNPR